MRQSKMWVLLNMSFAEDEKYVNWQEVLVVSSVCIKKVEAALQLLIYAINI